MELHLDIPQDVPIIPNKKLKLLGGGAKFSALLYKITSQDPLIRIDRARALISFQQKTTSI